MGTIAFRSLHALFTKENISSFLRLRNRKQADFLLFRVGNVSRAHECPAVWSQRSTANTCRSDGRPHTGKHGSPHKTVSDSHLFGQNSFIDQKLQSCLPQSLLVTLALEIHCCSPFEVPCIIPLPRQGSHAAYYHRSVGRASLQVLDSGWAHLNARGGVWHIAVLVRKEKVEAGKDAG